jgi:hypothetical protein
VKFPEAVARIHVPGGHPEVDVIPDQLGVRKVERHQVGAEPVSWCQEEHGPAIGLVRRSNRERENLAPRPFQILTELVERPCVSARNREWKRSERGRPHAVDGNSAAGRRFVATDAVR